MAHKIGIYSGSFDPVHEGHVAFAREALEMCGLDTIVFMPERFPRGKPNVSPISERLTKLEIALASTPFEVLNTHTDRFTVDETLTELEALYPETDFTFLIGSDVALNLPNWKNAERILSRYNFAIGIRGVVNVETLRILLDGIGATYVFIKTNHSHLASSQLRS